MDFIPVGKTTRSQKAKLLKELTRKASLAARNEWKKEKEKAFGGNCDGKKVEFLRVLEENGDDVILIDEDEFLNPDYKCGSVKKSEIGEVGIVKKEVFDHDDDVYHDHHETPLFNDGKGKGVIVNDDESDSSLQIIEVRYNPLGFDDDDDVDVVESHKRDEVDNVASEAPSDSKVTSSSEENDDVADEDFAEVEETSDRSESSSSDNSVEEVDERELHSSNDAITDDDVVGDDDEVRPDNRKEKIFDFVVDGHVIVIDDDDDFEGGDDENDDHVVNHQKNHDDVNEVRLSKRRDRISDAEIKRRVLSIGKERQQENGVKVKRERPPKNKNVVDSEFQPCSKKVRKASKDDEIQNTLLNTMLEKGNKGLDEILANANVEFYLPLKFKYGVEEVIVDEKTEDELEVDDYFKELDFALQASNIGVDDSFVHDNEGGGEDNVLSNDTISQKELCAKGKHYLIHDDEIGVICKFCSYVNLEIKHVMPEFNKDPYGWGNKRGYYRNLYEESGGFQFPDCSYDHGGDHYPDPSDDIQGTVWDLIPRVKRTLYPHQRDGFEFIWKNIAGGRGETKSV